MIGYRRQRRVADVTRVVEGDVAETAVHLIVTAEPRQAVVAHRTQSQFDASESRKQNRQTLQRLVVDVAQSSTTSASLLTILVEAQIPLRSSRYVST